MSLLKAVAGLVGLEVRAEDKSNNARYENNCTRLARRDVSGRIFEATGPHQISPR
jgi:hypothetical protein